MLRKIHTENSLLAILMQEPILLLNQNQGLGIDDFTSPIRQTIFSIIFTLAMNGAQKCTSYEISVQLKDYPTIEVDKAIEYLNILESLDVHSGTYDTFYEDVKKMSLLRDYEKIGFDTATIYNPNGDSIQQELENRKLELMTRKEIINHFRNLVSKVELSNAKGLEMQQPQFIGHNFIENIKNASGIVARGASICGDIFTTITRGARLGSLYLLSAPTSHGKTRFMMGNAAQLSLPRVEKNANGKLVIKGRENLEKALYIGTELSFEELQRMATAYVSGISESKLLNPLNWNDEERKRIALTDKILKEYQNNLLIVPVNDVSIGEVRALISSKILSDNFTHIFYDYIEVGPNLLVEFKTIQMRNDEILLMFATALKEIAINYDVFIMTATQTNDKVFSTTGLRNQNCISNAKSLANKVDVGVVMSSLKLMPDDYDKVREILNEANIAEEDYPTVTIDVYKNRGGAVTGVKIFLNFDYSTLSFKNAFITDGYYNTLDVENIVGHILKEKEVEIRL